MIRTLRAQLATLVVAAMCVSAPAQAGFENLDFESATVVSHDDLFGFLDWTLAAPAWSHGGGPDTDTVYHGLTHVGLTPWYLLVDADEPSRTPLQGRYSLAFASGYADPQSTDAGWSQAYVAQQGTLSGSTRSISFLATGAFELRVNGDALPVLALGQDRYAADVSAYAGQMVELRFANVSLNVHDPVVLDDIRLSSAVLVPEPAASASALGGLVCVAGMVQRRASRRARAKLVQ